MDVEAVRVRELLRVEVRALHQDQNQLAPAYEDVPERDVLQSEARQGVADGEVDPQQFLHARADQVGAVAQQVARDGVGEQVDQGHGEEAGGGDDTGPEHGDADGGQHLVAQVGVVGVVAQRGEFTHQAVGGRVVEQGGHPGDVPVPVDLRAGDRARRVHEGDVEAAQEGRGLGLRDAEHAAVHARGVRLAEGPAQIRRRAVGLHQVHQVVGLRTQPLRQAGRLGVERLHHRPAQPGPGDVAHVVDDLGRDGERVLAGYAGRGGVLEREAVVLQDLLAQLVGGHQPGLVAGDGPHAPYGGGGAQVLDLGGHTGAVPGEREVQQRRGRADVGGGGHAAAPSGAAGVTTAWPWLREARRPAPREYNSSAGVQQLGHRQQLVVAIERRRDLEDGGGVEEERGFGADVLQAHGTLPLAGLLAASRQEAAHQGVADGTEVGVRLHPGLQLPVDLLVGGVGAERRHGLPVEPLALGVGLGDRVPDLRAHAPQVLHRLAAGLVRRVAGCLVHLGHVQVGVDEVDPVEVVQPPAGEVAQALGGKVAVARRHSDDGVRALAEDDFAVGGVGLNLEDVGHQHGCCGQGGNPPPRASPDRALCPWCGDATPSRYPHGDNTGSNCLGLAENSRINGRSTLRRAS